MNALLKPTMIDHANILRIYAGGDDTARRFVIWYEGRDRTIVRKRDESPADVWARVLEQVQDMRRACRFGYWQGREFAPAHIYAGVTPSKADKGERMREWVTHRLYRLADPMFNDDDNAQVAALGAQAELHGLHEPRRLDDGLRAYLLGLVEAELARRAHLEAAATARRFDATLL